MVFVVPASETRSFRRRPSRASSRSEAPLLREALRGEQRELEDSLGRFSDVEAAIRLRALNELEAVLCTDALCALAARAC